MCRVSEREEVVGGSWVGKQGAAVVGLVGWSAADKRETEPYSSGGRVVVSRCRARILIQTISICDSNTISLMTIDVSLWSVIISFTGTI